MDMRSTRLIVAAAVVFAGSLSRATATREAAATSPQATQPASGERTYVGSQSCRKCHTATYERWSKTRMANVVVDPRTRPDVILPDLSKPDPLVTFTRDDIAFTYGSKWKQRYFKKVGDDFF